MSTDKNKPAELSFEEALSQLEGLVRAMEDGEIPLSDLIAKYEQGTKLLSLCQNRLKDAELKIELLKQDNDVSPIDIFQPES